MIFAAILAGGVGSRMSISDVPKQFLPLSKKPIVIHTIEKFMMCERFDAIYIGMHPDWISYMEDLLEKFSLKDKRIHVAAGGTDRNSTLFNVIKEIENDYEEAEDNIIVTHDAVRPFITQRIINENIDTAEKYGACNTVVSAIDTIVSSKTGEFIDEIPDRRYMYQGQTPQSFKISLLKRLYNDLTKEEKLILTDACKICIVRDTPVKLVQGETSNLKITTVSDYKIAQAMLGGIEID